MTPSWLRVAQKHQQLTLAFCHFTPPFYDNADLFIQFGRIPQRCSLEVCQVMTDLAEIFWLTCWLYTDVSMNEFKGGSGKVYFIKWECVLFGSFLNPCHVFISGAIMSFKKMKTRVEAKMKSWSRGNLFKGKMKVFHIVKPGTKVYFNSILNTYLLLFPRVYGLLFSVEYLERICLQSKFLKNKSVFPT